MDSKKSNYQIINAQLKHPFNMIVSGITQSGKTEFTCNLLLNSDRLIDKNFDYIIWLYGEKTNKIKDLKNIFKNKFTSYEGIPSNLNDLIKPHLNGCMILDDLMTEVANNKEITNLFTRKCSHNNISVILITQNLYHSGTERVSIMRNTHYLTIFNNPLDQSITFFLAKKILPRNPKIFTEIFETATKEPHNYLFIDGKQDTIPEARFRTNIFHKYQKIFIPNK